MVRISLDESFDLLGVNELSSEMEVKAAYKRMALQTHPDKNPNNPAATEQFRRISEAYQRISRYMDDETDEDDEYDDEDDYDDEDYDDDYDAAMMFIFEKMFREFNGEPGPPGIRMRFDEYNQYGSSSSSSSSSRSNGPSNDEVPSSSSRNRMHHCDCPNCSGSFPRPGNGTAWREPEKKIYIPKSQRPKDPNKQPSDANTKVDPHANWLSEDERDAEATRKTRSTNNSNKPSSKKKKAGKKKKKATGTKDGTGGEKQHPDVSAVHQSIPSEDEDSGDEEPEEEDTAIYCMESAPLPPPPVKKTQTYHQPPQVSGNNAFKSTASDVPGLRTREGKSHRTTQDSSDAVAVESKEKGDDIGSNRNHKRTTVVYSASYKGGKAKSNQAADASINVSTDIREGAANNTEVGSNDYNRKPVYNNKNEKATPAYSNNTSNNNNNSSNIKSTHSVKTDKGVVDAKMDKPVGSNAKATNNGNGHEKVVGSTKMDNNNKLNSSSTFSTATTITAEKKPVEESKGYKAMRPAASNAASAKTIHNNLSYAKDLSVLTEMGFDVRPALEALQRAMGNLDTALNILVAAAEAEEEAAKVASNAYIHGPSEKSSSDVAGQFSASSSSSSLTHPRSRNEEQSEQFEIDNNNKNNINSKRPHVKPAIASMKTGLHATEGPKKVNKKCNFFLSAVGCRNGSSCKFIHETTSTS